jgi:hypothetical protein
MANGEWVQYQPEIPPALQAILDATADVLDAVAQFLDLVALVLDIIATVAQALLDAYSAIVNALIDLVQNFLEDLKNAGIYVFLDYPNTLSLSDFNPAAPENWEGTVFDDEILAHEVGQDLDLAEIAKQRKGWARQQKALMSMDDVNSRIVASFSDGTDPFRPRFSEDALTYGVVILVYSEELALFLKLVRAVSNLFSLTDLKGVLKPAMLADDFKSLYGKAVDEWTAIDWEDWNPQLPVSFRNPGKFPNWIGRFTLGELVPPLGQMLQALSNMLELLRPNGDITAFIQGLITALKKKIKRIRDIAALLAELADALRSGFSGTRLCVCTIQSAEGNRGFTQGLLNAKGAPTFTEAICCSIVLYTGGPGIAPMQMFFGGGGEPIPGADPVQNGIDEWNKDKTEPVVTP